MEIIDCIVVGSGPAGAMAAQTLLEAGASVKMVDVGFEASSDSAPVPTSTYLDLRRHDPDQRRYFIGDEAEGVAWGTVSKGEHITPPRRHIMRGVDRLLPTASDSFAPFESLGYGGLGIGWGLGCWQLSHAELRACGLDPERMREAYREINRRIGISAAHDDLGDHAIDPDDRYQPPPALDRIHEQLLRRYQRRRGRLREQGFSLGRPALALLTEDLDDRGRYRYRDLDFYADLDHSAWRPWMTVDALRRGGGLAYEGGLMVLRFKERTEHTELECLQVDSGERRTLHCRRLVIAASALGSARIVLRSVTPPGTRLPLLCNPYAYIPCLYPRMVGQGPEKDRPGFAQLALVHDATGDRSDIAMAAMYSYQSLMLFRIVRQAPLNFVDAGAIMRYLMTGFVIMGLQLPDAPGPGKHLSLEPDPSSPTEDRLRAEWADDEATTHAHEQRRRDFVRAMRQLGAYALSAIDPGPGSSIHYAGTVPFSEEPAPGRLTPNGRVHGTKRVYVADSAGFRYLPAKGLTWSIMANAHLTALNALGGS